MNMLREKTSNSIYNCAIRSPTVRITINTGKRNCRERFWRFIRGADPRRGHSSVTGSS
jgi:hypothetical protein